MKHSCSKEFTSEGHLTGESELRVIALKTNNNIESELRVIALRLVGIQH